MSAYRVLDVNDAAIYGGTPGRARVAVADLSYSGKDNTESMRSVAKRSENANRSRIVRRWRWVDCPAISVEVWREDD